MNSVAAAGIALAGLLVIDQLTYKRSPRTASIALFAGLAALAVAAVVTADRGLVAAGLYASFRYGTIWPTLRRGLRRRR